jgi:N-acetylglucosamine-6-sulfatase
MSARRRRLALLCGLLVLPTVFVPATSGAQTPAPRPNIVLILTDDQRWDAMAYMPAVQKTLIAKGTTFSNGFVVDPLCCPSRTSILTGQYSHTTGVYLNGGPHGGFGSFHGDSSTIATWLQGSGYQTALVGKYLNSYGPNNTYIPPGWTHWVAFDDVNGKYYDYQLNIDGSLVEYGGAPADYSTDVLGAQAVSFIESADSGSPLFLYYAPFAPHMPATPPVRYQRSLSDLPKWRPPSYNESNVSDKPAYIQEQPRMDAPARRAVDQFRKDQYRSLLAVNTNVRDIVQALKTTGRLDDTLIVYMSDNGLLWGEHRWADKVVPYDESIRVPFVIRYDGVQQPGTTDDHLVLNIDLAPTFAELAGVTAPGAEGVSLVPLFGGLSPPWRTDFLIEHLQGHVNTQHAVPSYCAVRTTDAFYAVYGTGEQELYHLTTDPYELTNVAGDPANAAEVAALKARDEELCNPPPPGFTFPP